MPERPIAGKGATDNNIERHQTVGKSLYFTIGQFSL